MTTRPILFFPPAISISPKTSKPIFVPPPHFPSRARQEEKLGPQFDLLAKTFEQNRVQISPAGAEPEQVVVLETAGLVQDFYNAVRKISGMEWLAEWDESDIAPDEDFYDLDNREAKLNGRVFLVMTNQNAMQELLSLWRKFVNGDKKFDFGLAKFLQVFELLRDVRVWGPRDRLREQEALSYWEELVRSEPGKIQVEIEFWFRHNEARRNQTIEELKNLLSDDGKILQTCCIPQITYHAALVNLTASSVKQLIEMTDSKLVLFEQIMFFRPTGQVVAPRTEMGTVKSGLEIGRNLPAHEKPTIALLDGLPVENHSVLVGRIIVDDPDDWAPNYPVASRQHGTAMASLIIHGDLSIPEKPLERPIYIRPILNASINIDGSFSEHVPNNVIGVDLVHTAVKRICEGDPTGAAAAPTVRIINFSVGDRFRPFDNSISPLARLIDWLSFKYNLLFVISAGNHPADLELDVGRDDFSSLKQKDRQGAVVKAIAKSIRHRRLLSPAESLNGLTVGAIHADKSTVLNMGYRFDAFVSDGMPSPLNAIGLGFRRAVKPEIFVPGGRQLFKEKLGSSHSNTIIEIDTSISEPGILVAAPGRIKGELTGRIFTRGTSNAAALVTREASIFLDFIEELRKLPDGQFLSEEHTPALLKAMLVHGAFWTQAADDMSKILKTSENSRRIREHLARFIGYGSPNYARVRGATDQRATLIGCGIISNTELKRFILPLPEDLGGKKAWRRLILTLAWLTPVNSSHRLYRGAYLSFNPPGKSIQATRKDVDWRAVQRGTVQHEVLIGDKAVAFRRGESLELEIACSADAGELIAPIRFALLATLEVDETEKIKVWEGVNEILLEIRERIALRRRV